MNINVKIKLENGAQMPLRASEHATGYDLYAHRVIVHLSDGTKLETATKGDTAFELASRNNCFTIDRVEVDTGIAIAPTHGYAAIAAARSSLCKSGLLLTNGIGVIDADYRGNIRFVFHDLGNIHAYNHIQVGTRIGQLIFHPLIAAEWERVNTFSATTRGTGGFGSTGNA